MSAVPVRVVSGSAAGLSSSEVLRAPSSFGRATRAVIYTSSSGDGAFVGTAPLASCLEACAPPAYLEAYSEGIGCRA